MTSSPSRRPPVESSLRVAVIGLWHLGTVTAAGLAHLGYRVAGWEPDTSRRARLGRGVPPVSEPSLSELMQEGLASGRLSFVADPVDALEQADFVLFTEDVPIDDRDEPDVSGLLRTAETVAPNLRPNATVVVQSQVPVGTCERLVAAMRAAGGPGTPRLVYCPENLRLGQAVERFLSPDMIIIGADDEAARARAETLFAPIQAPRVMTGLRSAEMAKHALNFLLATAISFGNEIGRLCEAAGTDAAEVVNAVRHDRRIGAGLPVTPGPPFAGGTLARDVSVLQRLAAQQRVKAPLLEGVVAVNEAQKNAALERLEAAFTDLRGVHVAVLGLTYKPGTSTLRRSLALELIGRLGARGATVTAFDPRAESPEGDVASAFTRAADPYAAVQGADALVIMTPWPEFRELDLVRLRRGMRRGVLIDTWSMLNWERAVAAGFSAPVAARSRAPS